MAGLSQSSEKAAKGPERDRTSRREPSLETTPTRPFLGLLTNFATCVDAGFGARRIFWIGAARGRVLTCVRPLMRLTRRGPGWESADQVQVRPTRLKRLSQSWFS